MIQMKKLAVLGLAAIFAGTSQVVPIAPIAQVQANQLAMLDPGVQQVKHPRKKKNVPTLPTSVIDAEQTNPEANLDPGTSLLLLSTFLSDYELSDYHTGSLFSLIHPETLREFSTLSFMNGASLEWPSFEFGASHESAALMAMANSADDLNSGQLQPKPDIIADVNPASMQQHPVDMAQLDNLKPWESVQNVFQQLIPQHVMKNNPLDAVNTLAFEQPTAKPALLAEQANELQAFWGLNPDGSLNLPTIHTSNEGPLNNTPYNDAPMVSEHILALQQADPQLDFPGESPAVLRSGVSTTSNEIEVTVDKSTILNLNTSAARIAVSNPAIVSAMIISPRQIQLVGNSVGAANLLIWENADKKAYKAIDISVQRDVSVLSKQLKRIDSGINIAPLAAEDTVILTGTSENRESAQLAVELAKAFFGGSGSSSAGGSGSSSMLSSQAPGSSTPGNAPQVINLIKIKGQPSTKMELLAQKLHTIHPNIQADMVPGPDGTEKLILRGKVATAGMVSKAVNMAGIFFGQPGIKVLTGPGGNMVREGGNEEFQAGATFNDNMDVNILQGSVITDASGNVISLMEVEQKPQIKVSIRFLDVSRQGLKQLGHSMQAASANRYGFGHFSGVQNPLPGRTVAVTGGSSGYAQNNRTLSAGGAADLQSAAGFGQSFGTGVTQVVSVKNWFVAGISALEENQKARTLSEPTLTLLSGEKSSFLAGGELPIPVLGNNGQITITYREFGIRLNLIATVTDEGQIHMQIAPEISSIDNANGVPTTIGTIPAIRTRRLQTTLQASPGESFVIAGLFSQADTDSISGTPGASRLPIIGSLFRNKNKSRQDNEMIVIIKPEILASNTQRTASSSAAPVVSQKQPANTPQPATAKQAPKMNGPAANRTSKKNKRKAEAVEPKKMALETGQEMLKPADNTLKP